MSKGLMDLVAYGPRDIFVTELMTGPFRDYAKKLRGTYTWETSWEKSYQDRLKESDEHYGGNRLGEYLNSLQSSKMVSKFP